MSVTACGDQPTDPGSQILDEAKRIINGQRQQDYGTVEDNFGTIAAMWKAFKKVDFTTQDVAAMMALMKLARLSSQPGHHDSIVDLAGYAGCYARCKTTDMRSKGLTGFS